MTICFHAFGHVGSNIRLMCVQSKSGSEGGRAQGGSHRDVLSAKCKKASSALPYLL